MTLYIYVYIFFVESEAKLKRVTNAAPSFLSVNFIVEVETCRSIGPWRIPGSISRSMQINLPCYIITAS